MMITSEHGTDTPKKFTVWTLVYYFVKCLVLLVPPLNYSSAFIKYAYIWYENATAMKPDCGDGRHLFDQPLNFSSELDFCSFYLIQNCIKIWTSVCNIGTGVKEFLVYGSPNNPNGLLLEVIFMMINIILYSLLLAVIEAGYVSKLFNTFVVRKYAEVHRETVTEPVDPDVELERKKVESQTQQLAGKDYFFKNALLFNKCIYKGEKYLEAMQLRKT